MPEQTQLECVSCETAFDPSPNGGFCPNCDTPHPEYDAPDADGDAADDSEPVNEITDGGGNVITDTDDGVETDAADDSDDATAAEDDADESAETDADEDAPAEADADEDAPAETDEAADEDDAATIECRSCESTVDVSASFCPNCGEEVPDEVDEDDEPVELEACPDCGNSVDDESYCPNCGTDLDAIRESGGVDADESDADAEDVDADGEGDADADVSDDSDAATDDDTTADDADDTDAVPQEVTLEIDGEPYTFEDGDVFGRRDEEWLADLVSASGGREEARYLSSEHLEFAIEDDGVYVTDVSTNGTKLNGTPMDGSEEQLEDGDTLELADRAEIDVSL